MSAMRQPFPVQKSGGNTQTNNNSSDLSSYKIDPETMMAPEPRQNTFQGQVNSSFRSELSVNHGKGSQNTTWDASDTRSSNHGRQDSALVSKARFSEPPRSNGASFQKKAKPAAKKSGSYTPEVDVNQQEELTTNSRSAKTALVSKEVDGGKHCRLPKVQSTNHKRLRQSLEGTNDISSYSNVPQATVKRSPHFDAHEHPRKRRQNGHVATLQSAAQRFDQTEVPDSESPQPSSEVFFDDANDNPEEDEFQALGHTDTSPQDTETKFTEGTVELGSMDARPNSSSGSRHDVIDLTFDRSNNAQQYQTPALYLDKNAAWEVSNALIPSDPQKIVEWENFGQSIAKRGARLVSEYITHRRNRANLFNRVQVRIADQKRHLEKRESALAKKLTTVSSQCESLIKEVKTGNI